MLEPNDFSESSWTGPGMMEPMYPPPSAPSPQPAPMMEEPAPTRKRKRRKPSRPKARKKARRSRPRAKASKGGRKKTRAAQTSTMLDIYTTSVGAHIGMYKA